MPIIAINNENELISSLNAITATNHKWYRRYYALKIAVQIWGGYGGNWYVEGLHTDPDHEWQIAISYGPQIRRFVRSKYSGVWGDWVDISISPSYTDLMNKFTNTDSIMINKAYIQNRMVFIMGHLVPSPAGSYKLLIPYGYRPRFNMAAPHYVSNSADVGCASAVYIESASTIAVWTNRANAANITFSFLYPI